MRDVVFKNLTSEDKRRRILASSEIFENDGTRSVIRRHFLYRIREIDALENEASLPQVYIVKERNRREQKERFFCKIKGNVCVCGGKKIYRVTYIHSLRIGIFNLDIHQNVV